MPTLQHIVETTIANRCALFEQFKSQNTTAFRLFHGINDGRPGLNIDRFGDRVLVTTSRQPLSPPEQIAISKAVDSPHPLVFAHRGKQQPGPPINPPTAPSPYPIKERGVDFVVDLSGRKLDPALFLDFRGARRYVSESCQGLSVLNFFAYTCTMGLVAVLSGAEEVINTDHSTAYLDYGKENYRHNNVVDRFVGIQGDFTPIARQYAGLTVSGRAARKHPYPRLSPKQFDLVILDPPTRTKSPFGGVDINRDYPSLLKPALLATRPGGRLLATHHHRGMSRQDWRTCLEKTTTRAGRELRQLEFLPPEPDFPSFDGDPPLKIAILAV